MSTEVQGFLQTSPPLIDETYAAAAQVIGTIGNVLGGATVAPYGEINGTFGSWTLTGAGSLLSDYGGTSYPLSGVEANQSCTAGTVHGFGPAIAAVSGPFLKPPAGTLVLPYSINLQCVRFEVFGMYWDVVPTGTQCLRDSGIVFANGGAAQGVVFDNPQTGNGGQNYGWGVVVDTATGQLMFVAKQVQGIGGVGLSAKVDLGAPANGLNKPFYLDLRWYAATLASPASIQILLDGTDLTPKLTSAQSSWIVGTKLPSLDQGGGTLTTGFQVSILNNTPTGDTVNPLLHFQSARVRVGSIAAVTLENQH